MAKTFPSLQKVLLDRCCVEKVLRFLFGTFEHWDIRNPNVWRYMNLLLWFSKYLVNSLQCFRECLHKFKRTKTIFSKYFGLMRQRLCDFIFSPWTIYLCVDTKTIMMTKLNKTFSRLRYPINSKWNDYLIDADNTILGFLS